MTGCGIVKAPLMKVNRIEILGSSISEENVATVCHDIPKGIAILGYSFLKNCYATFNWKEKKFSITRKRS